jgi:oligopeptide/dipeptide ABC transporter ATP-binding protein
MPSTNANTHEWLREVRHDLHAHPELAFKEFRTTERIIKILSGLGWDVRPVPGSTGAIGLMQGSGGGPVYSRHGCSAASAFLGAHGGRRKGIHAVQSRILNLLLDLRKELGLTYILISHNLSIVEHMVSCVAVMYLGRIVEQAPTADLFRSPRHPYTRALLDSVLTPEPEKGLPETHLGIAYPNPIDPPPGCTFHPRCSHAKDVCRIKPPLPVDAGMGMVECHFPLI